MGLRMKGEDFPCTRCGLCCREYAHFFAPALPVTKEGLCSHQEESGECGIYEDRPGFCRVGESSWEYQAAFCNKLQEKHGFDEKWRVIL